jgi:hypothetical protein
MPTFPHLQTNQHHAHWHAPPPWPAGTCLDLRALHPLLGEPEHVYVLLYGSLWLWALANLTDEFALLARRRGGPQGERLEMVVVPSVAVDYVLGASKVCVCVCVCVCVHSQHTFA